MGGVEPVVTLRGRGRACPARGGVRGHPSMVRSVGRGLDPSAGVGGSGRLPLIRPCGATFPQGGRQGVVGEGFIPPEVLAAARAPAGRRGRRPLRFARERAAAEGCPSSGPAGPPSPEGEGRGCRGGIHPSRDVCANASLRGASGTPPPTGCPGTGGGGRSRRGEGTPPYGWGYGNAAGFTRAPVPGPPRGRGRACPARGVTRAPVNGSARREGS